jgi:hypothetical protein
MNNTEMVIYTLRQALLEDPDVSNRLDAVEALAVYGEDCIPSLCEVLARETNTNVRASIIAALRQLGGNSQIIPQPATLTEEKQVFISYAWGGESEEITNKIEGAFQAKGITIIRDKKNLKYKESIKEFMQRIGQGRCVIAVISDSYLKSENCMFELLEVTKNRDWYDRIFPLVLPDARNIYSDRLNYIIHWEQEKTKLQDRYREVKDLIGTDSIMKTLNLYDEIRRNIDRITSTFKDMNTLSLNIHVQSEFAEMIEAVVEKLSS